MSWEEYRSDMREQERAHSWRDFERRFMELTREEQGRTDAITKGETVRRIDRVLRAHCSYREHPEGWEKGKPEQGMICLLNTPSHGVWNYGDGISENFRERVRLCIAEAGRVLPDYPTGKDPEDFWLHRLYLDLLENNSDLLFCASKEGGMILSVCVASATFCSRLQRKALEQSEPGAPSNHGSVTRPERLRTGNHAESSRIQNSAQSVPRVESKSETTASIKSPEALIDHAIASRKRMLERLGRPEEVLNANPPPALDAEKSKDLLGIELVSLEYLRREVWKKFFDEARISDVVKDQWQSVLSMRKVPDGDVDLGLTFALTKEYQKAISRASAQLADLLATAAGWRMNQAQLREAIWRECLDFAYQLGQWDAFATWVHRAVHIGWQTLDADGQPSLIPDRESERRLKERRNFFEGRIGIYSRDWLSAIDEAIELRLTVSVASSVKASGEIEKQTPNPTEEATRTAEDTASTSSKPKSPIGRNIDRLRKECGWSFDKLADETGIDKKSILSHVNKGTIPRPRILKEYAQAFSKALGRTITAPELEV